MPFRGDVPDLVDVVELIAEKAGRRLIGESSHHLPPRRCSQCGDWVYPRARFSAEGAVEYVLDTDSRGWCSDCLHMEEAG